jgi:hypothetical protein
VVEDIALISKLWETHHAHSFALPSRNNLVVEAKAVEDGKLVGYGQVRLVAEPILVLDLDATARQKHEALRMLMLEAYRGTEQAQVKHMFAFVRDPNFADILTKHYAFERAEQGEVLVKEF